MENKTIKILAIDDIQDNLITLKALISESFKNVNVLTALSGKIGLEIAALENPDVILLDIIMPEMDGYEVCKLLKADALLKEIPVVFITALKGDKTTRIKALEVGAEAFLAKPIDESELVAQINAMVKIKEANFEEIHKEKILLELVAEKTKSLEESNRKAHNLLNDLLKENEARKLSDKNVLESEDKYVKAFNTSPYCITITSLKEGTFVDVNDSFCKTTGYSKDEVIGNSVEKINIWFNNDDRNQIITKLLENKKIENDLGYFKKKNGEKLIGLFSAQVIKINGIAHILASINDITQQKLAEEKLNKSQEQYKDLVTKIPIGVYVLRSKPNGNFAFEYVSPRMAEILNTPAQEIIENVQAAFKYIHPEDLEAAILANQEGIANKKPRNWTGRYIINEKIKWINISSIPELQANGDILWHGLMADITEQKLAEIELNNTHQKLEVLMDAIPDLLFEVGIDGTIYNYHTNKSDLLVDSPDNFLGKKFVDILPEHASKVCQLAIIEASEKGISTGKQYSLQLPQGELWFDVSVAPIKNIGNEISRYVFLARDVTVQKKSVLELVKLNRTQALNSQINDLIIRIHNKMELFEEVCNIAITHGNYKMSWISEINDQTKAILPLVWYGHEDGYLMEIQKISIQNNLFGNGPTGIALREGKVAVCNNIASDPKMEPWREAALKRGYASSIALPIIVRKKVIGTFNLYAGEVDFFALNEEVELLENITTNIAFSLEKMLDEEDRLKAEEKVREKDIEFRKLSANVPDLLYQFTRRPNGTYFVPIASEGIINIFGCKPEDVANDFTAIANVIYPEDAERVINEIEQSAANGSNFTCEFRVQIPGKPIQWIYSKSTPEKLADGSVTWYGFNTDITERKQAEEKILQNEAFLKETQIIASLGTYTLNISNNCWESSEILNSIFGIEPTYVKTIESWSKLVHPEWSKIMLDYFLNEVIGKKKMFDKEYKIIRQNDNTERWVHGIGKLEFDNNKNPIKMIGAILDITERKQAEELLLRYTLLLEESQEIAKVGGWELDLILNKLYWTAETYKIHETSPEEFNPTVDAGVSYFLPESKQLISEALDNAIINGIGYDLYLETYTTKGNIINVRTTCDVTTENGKPVKLTGIFQDITDIKHTEKALLIAKEKAEESETKLKVMVSAMPDLVWFKDQNGFYLECNQRFEDFIGFSQEQLIGKTDYDLFDKDLADFFRKNDKIARDAGKSSVNEEELTFASDGHKEFLETIKTPIYDSNKGIIGVLGISRNITERKLAEQKNIESLQIIEGIINTINVRVFWKDKNLKYLGCNKVFALDAGFIDPKELIGKDDFQMGWKYQAELYRADDLRVIESGEAKLNIEEVQTTPDGNTITLLTNKIPIKNANNETYGVLGTYIDISERKKIEVDLLKSKMYLQTILESTEDGILAVNSKHEVIYYNNQFEKIWNIPYQLSNKNNEFVLLDFVKNQLIDPDTFLRKVEELYHTDAEDFDVLYFKDGRVFERYTNSMFLEGQLHGRVWSFRDITEKRKVEHEKENAISTIRKLSVAIEQSPVTTVITDLDGNIVFVNPKFTETTGYTFQEVIGKNPRILNTGYTSKSKYIELWQTILAGNSWNGEFKNKKKNGEFFWERATISPVKNEAGEITNFLAVKEDITLKKIADEAFQKNVRELEDYKFAIDQSAIVSITNNDGIITYANQNFSKICKYSNEELVGSNHRIVNSGYHPKEYFANMWNTITNGKVWVGELRNKAKDGSFYWVHGTIIPFLDIDNKPFRYLSIRFDITERKKAEEGILESNERYNLVAKATNDSIWDLNILTNEIVRSGNGFEVLFGYKKTEDNVDYPYYRNLIHPDDLNKVIASKNKVFNNPNEYYWEEDYRFLKANGEYAFVHDKGFIIRDKNGKAIRMIGATQDVTEREKHIKAIEEQNSKLRDIAWIQSHVVRAPLSRMMGIVNLLNEVELNSEEFKEWVGHFNTSSAELDKVIHDISNKSDEFDLRFKK